jgi:hypothetical protein
MNVMNENGDLNFENEAVASTNKSDGRRKTAT